jgi:hypothetical protein
MTSQTQAKTKTLVGSCITKRFHEVACITLIISEEVAQSALKMKCKLIFVILWVFKVVGSSER